MAQDQDCCRQVPTELREKARDRCARYETTVWVQAHEELSRLARRRAESDWEEGQGLLAAFRAGVHRYLGFASFAEYVESLFGYKPRSVEEKLRVAEALERLPLLSGELREGRLRWSAARELTRVATAETEQAWHALARGKTVRQLEEWVSGRTLGDKPDSPADPALKTHVLAFEVRAETLATYRDALAKLRRESGEQLDEETALLLMARQVLGGPTDEGRANYQIALTICEHCRQGFQCGRGIELEVEPHVVSMAACDAQYIGRVRGSANAQAADGSSSACAHVGEEADPVVTDGPDALVRAHVGAQVRAGTRETPATPGASGASRGIRSRALQRVPPAVRRLVMRRDGKRCVVPGCMHAVFLDLHHLDLRSEGGGHEPDSLVMLCAAHHRALHRGSLVIEGCSAKTLVFRHADGSEYRGAVCPPVANAHTRAFAALRKLGFGEGEVKRALAQLRPEAVFNSASVEEVVRAALQVLTASACVGASQRV